MGVQYYESNSPFAAPYLGLTGRRHYLGVGLDGLRRREKHFAAACSRGNCWRIRPRTDGHRSTCTDAGGLSQRHRHAGASANSHALSYYGAVSHTGLDAWPARRDLREGGRLLGPRSRSPSVRPD